MIDGHTRLIAHIGHPTHTFKSPMIYNPYFEAAGINAVVVPMDCTAQPYIDLFERNNASKLAKSLKRMKPR